MKKFEALEQLFRQYRKNLASSEVHDVKQMIDGFAKLELRKNSLDEEFASFQEEFTSEIADFRSHYENAEAYWDELLKELEGKNIRYKRDDKGIMLGPMSLKLDNIKMVVEMQFGRKKQTLSKLKPKVMAAFVVKYYESLNRSFKLDSFVRQLVLAYEYANRTKLGGNEVNFGQAVSLNDIYSLFNISPVNHGYKKENFLWDLGRLISNLDEVKDYSIELGYSRNVGKMELIYDVHDQEHKVSSLTVYKKTN